MKSVVNMVQKCKLSKMVALLLVMFSVIFVESYGVESTCSMQEMNEIDFDSLRIVDEKVYVSPDQVIVSSKGIDLILTDIQGNLVRLPISGLSCDSEGLFLPTETLQQAYIQRCRWCLSQICRKCNKCTYYRCIGGRICRCW